MKTRYFLAVRNLGVYEFTDEVWLTLAIMSLQAHHDLALAFEVIK